MSAFIYHNFTMFKIHYNTYIYKHKNKEAEMESIIIGAQIQVKSRRQKT